MAYALSAMSKAETINALMESATLMFAKNGYEGASLRDIARSAGVPLSTIHLYFGSKSELFIGVRQAAWLEVDQERHAYLDEVLAKNAEGDALLAGIIHALAHPITRRATSKAPRDMAQILLIRAHWNRTTEDMMVLPDIAVTRWLGAMKKWQPEFSTADATWALSFAVGAIHSWQFLDFDKLIGMDIILSAEDVTGDIVAFCCSGIKAIFERRVRGRR